jgi:2-polyprenyl-3-methyl-5-hydroxy-6-metoxy-1,4-benzoquinol methylase
VNSHDTHEHDPGGRLAAAYVSNRENRGAFDRVGIFSASAQLAGRPSPDDFLVGGAYERYAERELAELASCWEPYLPESVARILDAGCGAGVTTLALARRYSDAQVLGIDVETPAIDLARYLARTEPRCTFRKERLERLDESNTFDLIQCRCVLEHVYDPNQVLVTLIRHLSPGGVLYLEAPNYFFPWEPHVGMPIIPKSPKWLLVAQCRLTGRDPAFVHHLNLSCDPLTIRRWALRSDPTVHIVDLMARKAAAMFDSDDVRPRVAGRARIVAALKRFRPAARGARWVFTHLPISPSVTFLIVKPSR